MISLKIDFRFRAVLGLQQHQVERIECAPPLHTNSPINTSHDSAIVHYMGFDKCIMSDIHHYSIRLVSMPPNFSELNLFKLSYTSSLAITNLFTAVIVCLLQNV